MKITEIVSPIRDIGSAVIDVGGHNITIVKSKADRQDPMVMIDVAKFDPAFAKETDFYIGAGGTGNPIRDRYKRFMDFLNSHDTIEASTVSVRPDGAVDFINGRHRYAVLRDHGVRQMPVVMMSDSLEDAQRYGYLV